MDASQSESCNFNVDERQNMAEATIAVALPPLKAFLQLPQAETSLEPLDKRHTRFSNVPENMAFKPFTLR